ncbi:hypothetical protein SLE2022_374850 [Rubroshorea leprosula]
MSPPPTINGCHRHNNKPCVSKPPAVPDIFLTAFSLLFLFSSPKAHQNRTLLPRCLSSPPKHRRFLRISTMSLTNSHFPTPQALSDWLKPRLPSDSFASWGVKPGTKNVHNLWLELSEGETCLADSSPPLRTVNVVTVRIIGKDNRFLVESRQELSDGSIRDRFRPLSEKMKPDENPEEAAIRAVKEELGSIINLGLGDGEVIKIVPGSYQKKMEERNSVSYPGLPACYVLHSLDAWVEGLPEGEFCTEEGEEYKDANGSRALHKAVTVRKHYWKWVSPS